MNKNDEPRYFWISSLFVIGLLLVSTGCVRYRFDARQDMIRASGSRVWAVSVTKDGMGQKIHSFTRLNGARKLEERPSVIISSGKSGNWSWEVRMTPSLLASWYAWQANPRVISRTREKNTWAQPAATWDEAFERALKVSEYLMGKPSLPLKATLLLVPEGTKYKRTVIENAERYTPLTFAFYYPIADTRNSTLDSARFSAMAFAVATMMHEYQHALYGTGFSPAVGNSKVERTINDESRSECWLDSTLLSLTVGTHSSSLLSNEKHGRGSAVVDRVSGKGKPLTFSDAAAAGTELEAETIAAYLKKRGIVDGEIRSTDPAGMNVVLSACRAMTQFPHNFANGAYPLERIEYVPFFPSGSVQESDAAKP